MSSSSSKKKTILIAAGGTGGHLFPALNLRSALLKEGFQVFVATDTRGLERMRSYGDASDCFCFPSGAIVGKSVFTKLKSALSILKGVLAGVSLIHKNDICMVIGMGGYPSVAPMVAGRVCRLPLIAHEGNAVLGKANLLAVKLGATLAASLPLEKTPSVLQSRKPAYTVTGMPIKEEILKVGNKPYSGVTSKGPIKLLVWGGSLGSESLSILVTEALCLLPKALKDRLEIVQQAPETKMAEIKKLYASGLIEKVTLTPFLKEVPEVLAETSLVIGRSGGATVAELQGSKRPSILFPLPSSAYGEQKANARAFEELGGGWMFNEKETTAQSLATFIEDLLSNPSKLTAAHEKLEQSKVINATQALVKLVRLEIEK